MEVQQQNQKENINQSISEIETTAPGKLRVIKRNGKVVPPVSYTHLRAHETG